MSNAVLNTQPGVGNDLSRYFTPFEIAFPTEVPCEQPREFVAELSLRALT